MKPSSRPPRTPSKLSDLANHRLNMYVLAASAAGVGIIALTPPLEAKIVFTKAHHPIPRNTTYNLDLNHDRITDFTISNWYSFTSIHSVGGSLTVKVLGSNAVMAGSLRTKGSSLIFLASALRADTRIQANTEFRSKHRVEMAGSWASFGVSGNTG